MVLSHLPLRVVGPDPRKSYFTPLLFPFEGVGRTYPEERTPVVPFSDRGLFRSDGEGGPLPSLPYGSS